MGYDWQAVLLRQRGDPTIICRDRGAGHFESSTHFRVKWQCFLLLIPNAYSPSEIIVTAARGAAFTKSVSTLSCSASALIAFVSRIISTSPVPRCENLEHSQPFPNPLLPMQKGGANLAPNAWTNHDSKANPVMPFLNFAQSDFQRFAHAKPRKLWPAERDRPRW